MKSRVVIQKRTPKYFHSDGNGIHLKTNKHYKVIIENRMTYIHVLKEYEDFYLVSVNGNYKSTISKYVNDFIIVD